MTKRSSKPVRVCPCGAGSGFTRSEAPDGRPMFHCQRCGKNWTAGHSGEPYIGGEQEAKKPDSTNS